MHSMNTSFSNHSTTLDRWNTAMPLVTPATGRATVTPLAPGAVWRGRQTSGKAVYDVEVRICSIAQAGDITGTLTIRNLAPSLPKVTTYFDGEIVGKNHSFVTDKWGATEDDDIRHWGRFKRDLGLRGVNELDDTLAEETENVVFMRLKERCITDGGRSLNVSEASFAGFYYIAISLNPAEQALAEDEDFFRPGRSASPSPLTSCNFSDENCPFHQGSYRRSSSPLMRFRSDSYASVVRGDPPTFAYPIAIPGVKAEDVNVTVGSVSSSMSSSLPFSPSFEEFPPPVSPVGSPSRLSDSPIRSMSPPVSVARMGRARSNSVESAPSAFHNVRTGYKGPWAHAVMKGFYFASSSDPYQELELNYVGDGMGVLLEEQDEEVGGVDEWGNVKPVDEKSNLKKEMMRRQRYDRPRASASFTML